MDQITGRHIRPRQIHYLKLKKKKKGQNQKRLELGKKKLGQTKT